MMRIDVVGACLVITTLLSGCEKTGEDKAVDKIIGTVEDVKDVAWYRSHEPERREKLTECSNNPGELQETPNCINAEQAALLEMSGPSKIDYSKAFK